LSTLKTALPGSIIEYLARSFHVFTPMTRLLLKDVPVLSGLLLASLLWLLVVLFYLTKDHREKFQQQARICYLWLRLVSSLAIRHMKNPTALAMKDRIVKVSTRIQGVR
jgi:hypothetical protein